MPLPGAPPADWQAPAAGAARPARLAGRGRRRDGGGAGHRRRDRRGATRPAAPTASRSILCRTHRQAAPSPARWKTPGIPVLYLGPLFERPEVRDLLALLSLAAEGNGWGLCAPARLTGRPVDRAECAALISYARAAGDPVPPRAALAARPGLSARRSRRAPSWRRPSTTAGAYRGRLAVPGALPVRRGGAAARGCWASPARRRPGHGWPWAQLWRWPAAWDERSGPGRPAGPRRCAPSWPMCAASWPPKRIPAARRPAATTSTPCAC